MRAYRNRQSTIFEQLEDGERRVFEKALKGSISALDTSGMHLPKHNYAEPDDFLFPLTDHTSGGVDTEEGDAVELPFRPVLDKLRFYFRLKFGKRMFLQEGRATTSEARYDIAAERLGLCEPYSGEWLECLALTYLRKLDSLAEANASTDEIIATAVGLGRLVEHYRWRLLHGENAVRGKKVRDNPKKGAEA